MDVPGRAPGLCGPLGRERGDKPLDQLTLAGASVVWSVASGVFIAVLGVLSLFGGRSRPRGTLAFSLFAIFWGIQISLANIAGHLGAQTWAVRLYLLSLAFLFPLAYFLVEFVAGQTGRRGDRGLWDLLRWTTAGTAFVAALLLMLAPDLLFEGVVLVDGVYFPSWGPLQAALVGVPHFAALGVALMALAAAGRRSPTPRVAKRSSTLVMGLGLYAAFTASNNLVVFGGQILSDPTGNAVAFTLLFAALTLVAVYVGTTSLTHAVQTRNQEEAKRDRLLAVAIFVPLAWGVLEGGLVLGPVPDLDTVGLWRLAGIAVIAFGLARWWLPDLPERATRTAAGGVGVIGAVAGGAAAYGAGTLASSNPTIPVVSGLLAISASIAPSLRLSRDLFGVGASGDQAALADERFGEKLDTYRAAVETSMARGTLEEDRPFLDALGERFEISEDARRVLHHYAQKSVVVASDDGDDALYERLRLLGEGGGGRTWLARDRVQERLVVLKEPLSPWQEDDGLRERVLEEANLAARVDHPNVVTIEEVTEQDGVPVLVMEYLEGGSLADVLRTKGALGPEEAVPVLEGVLAGLAAVHDRGVIHRDLKPSNILFTGDERPVIADFGIAVHRSPDETVVDADQQRAGTLAYMAPEVQAGKASGDERADVYACGAVLYELLHGRPPDPPSPSIDPDVPDELRGLLTRALSPDPDQRPPSAAAFREALAETTR